MECALARWILFLLIIAIPDIRIALSALIVNILLFFLLLSVSIYHADISEVLIKILILYRAKGTHT